MNIYTEILGLPFYRGSSKKRRLWLLGQSYAGYHMLLKVWWDYFGLAGSGLIMGEKGKYGKSVKSGLMDEYPDVKEIFSIDLNNADINCDIQKELPVPKQMDWIICQSVLEHLGDPFGAMCNMFNVLKAGGRGFFHIPGMEFPYHSYPIDCCRFFKDVFFEWERLAGNVEIDDWLVCPNHCFVVYRRIV